MAAAESVLHKVAQFPREPFLQWDRKAHLVAPVGDRGRQNIGIGTPQEVFHPAALKFHVGRDGGEEFDQRMVEEGHAALQPVRHAHPIFDLK